MMTLWVMKLWSQKWWDLQCHWYSRLGARIGKEGTVCISSHLRRFCHVSLRSSASSLPLIRINFAVCQFLLLVNFLGLGANGMPRKCQLLNQKLPTSMNWKAKHQSYIHTLLWHPSAERAVKVVTVYTSETCYCLKHPNAALELHISASFSWLFSINIPCTKPPQTGNFSVQHPAWPRSLCNMPMDEC